MSQAQAQPAPAPPAAPPRPAPAVSSAPVPAPPSLTGQAPAAADRLDTPGRLRLLSLGVVVLGVVTGLVGALVLAALAYSLHRAEADTAQLVRVQQIQTNLLVADATATNAFLVGGLEPAAQRARYDEALTRTGRLVAEAARAQPADADLLAQLNQQVLAYAGSIEQARANNRQGLPVGAQYLRAASAELRAESLPVLDALVDTNAERATTRMAVWLGWVFLGLGLAALVLLVLAQVWVARRFRRTLNRGLLAASVVLAVTLVVGFLALTQLGRTVQDIQQGSFATVNAAAGARVGASDAKSNESLTLIARGSGAAFEKAWVTSADRVDAELARLGADAPTEEWARYREVHTAIRALDEKGDWEGAVQVATNPGTNSANAVFDAFDERLDGVLSEADRAARGSLAAQLPGLVVGAVLALLAGVAMALLGRAGVAARLREYR